MYWSKRTERENEIQYMSQGESRAGSDVRRALWEAKIGKRMVRMELEGVVLR